MASWDVLVAFAIATAVFASMPGPALLYTAAQTLARGRRGGFMAVLGIHLGCYAHVLAAALGLSVAFTHVPEAYAAVKLIGAAYLVWLGIGMIRSRGASEAVEVQPRSVRRALLDSFMVELLNPKVAIFFIAFLPQFVDPAGSLPVWAQFLILGVIVNFSFSSADVLTVLFASAVMRRIKRAGRGQAIVKAVGGAVLIGLGARLALDRN
jgi:threonine/homoserine/homoserine lactone efflux protein